MMRHISSSTTQTTTKFVSILSYSASSSTNFRWYHSKAEYEQGAKRSIDKKFAPPRPPVKNFVAPKPGEENKTETVAVLQSSTAAPTSTFKSNQKYYFEQQEKVFPTYDPHMRKNYTIINLSVRDVIEELEALTLSVVDVQNEIAFEHYQQEQQKKKGFEPTSTPSTSTTTTPKVIVIDETNTVSKPPQEFSRFSGNDTNNNISSSSSTTAIKFLRAPEDIILALRHLLQEDGKLPFAKVPLNIVRALVGHDGFGETPRIVEEGGEKTNEEILEAVAKVILPVGVLTVDRKRNVIKLKPGVPQLAARIDATICESHQANNATTLLKKVPFSVIFSFLTGTEKSFVRDVGGLSRIALLFPKQFLVANDMLSVQKMNNVLPDGKSYSPIGGKAKEGSSYNTHGSTSETFPDPVVTVAVGATTTQTIFAQGVQNFHQSEQARRARMTTGESLLKSGESIIMDDEE